MKRLTLNEKWLLFVILWTTIVVVACLTYGFEKGYEAGSWETMPTEWRMK